MDLSKILIKKIIAQKLPHNIIFVNNDINFLTTEINKITGALICLNNSDNVNCSCFNHQSLKENNFSDLIKVGNPDEPETEILKADIENIIRKFSLSSVNKKDVKIYIVYHPEKMNLYSANLLLSFLEKIKTNVYAFFLTSALDKVLPTIRSRCLNIVLKKPVSEKISFDKEIENDCQTFLFNLKNNKVKDFITTFETVKQKSIVNAITFLRCLNHNFQKLFETNQLKLEQFHALVKNNFLLISYLKNKVLWNKDPFWEVWVINLQKNLSNY